MKITLLISVIIINTAPVFADDPFLLGYFRNENPNITDVQLIEYVSNYHLADGLLVARGTRPGKTFTGNWKDELFGIFRTNKNLEVIKVMEFVPTRRWRDYCVEIDRKQPGQFVVRFYGCSYYDELVVREFDLE